MIYTVTLNPALDKTVVIPRFSVGIVNRVASMRQDVGGKGFNVSKCLNQLDCPSIAVGFLGGDTGAWAAQELEHMGIRLLHVQIQQSTRTNLKIIDPELHCNTDINESGPTIQPPEWTRLLEQLDEAVLPGDLLILSGSVPPGLSDTVYRDLILRFRGRGVKVWLDADGENLRTGITAMPDFIKPNLEELKRLTGQPLETEAQILAAARKLLAGGIGEVVVSLGGDGALFVSKAGCWKAQGLTVPVGSTVGAGDSMVAALAYGTVTGLEPVSRARLAIAISAASVMCSGTQPPERETIEKLYHQVTIQEVNEP